MSLGSSRPRSGNKATTITHILLRRMSHGLTLAEAEKQRKQLARLPLAEVKTIWGQER